jgi:hypothetical protein
VTIDHAASDPSERPFLRIRWQGSNAVETRTAPFVQSGRLTAVVDHEDGGVVVMNAGRTMLEFFIRDFAALFEGYDHARRLLRNAAQHNDFVEISVTRERLSYFNPTQYERVQKS